MYACQWSGVAMHTASIMGSERILRKSNSVRQCEPSPYALSTLFAMSLQRVLSQSQTATILTLAAFFLSRN